MWTLLSNVTSEQNITSSNCPTLLMQNRDVAYRSKRMESNVQQIEIRYFDVRYFFGSYLFVCLFVCMFVCVCVVVV